MQARRKPLVIEIQQFRLGQVQAWPPHVRFNPDTPAQPAVWNEPQQTWVSVHDGDYIRTDLPADVYPINPDYLEKHFDLVE